MLSNDIPIDLLSRIFEKLPPKTLILLRTICRQWNTLIGSTFFISRHLSVTASDPSRHQILMTVMYDGIYRLFTNPRNTYLIEGFRFPFTYPVGSINSILGLIHGVMCISFFNPTNKTTTFAMWNPSIRHSIVTPTFPAAILSYGDFMVGFGFNPVTSDLKIVLLPCRCTNCTTGPCTPVTTHIFSAQEGLWRFIPNNVLPCTTWFGEPNAPFLNTSIHWARSEISGRRFVLVFNCETEQFRIFGLPERYAGLNGIDDFTENGGAGKIDLQVFRGNLAVYEYDWQPWPVVKTCKITIMKEYGVVDSWSHVFTVQLDYDMGRILMAREEDGDEIIILKHHLLVAYNTRSNTERELDIRFEDQWTRFELFVFEPSLLLMGVRGSTTYRRGGDIAI